MSKGIDKSIDALLADFNAYLWKNNVRAFYGRVFRNEKPESTKISPEVWITTTKYIDVLKDNSKDAQCFFDVQPNETVNIDIHEATIWLCFMVDLSRLYPNLTRTEATEKVHTDVESLLYNSNFKVDGLVRGYEGFRGYEFGKNTQPKADMQPHYLFRFNLKCTYINSNCN